MSYLAKFNVYSADTNNLVSGLLNGVNVYSVNESLLDKYFRGDESRYRSFSRFLTVGHKGLLIATSNEWIAYGWLATRKRVPHLPLGISCKKYPWIFWCRTHEGFRRKGYYQIVLSELRQLAGRMGIKEVFIDVRAENCDAIRVVERCGFRTRGVIKAFLFDSPRFPIALSIGTWRGC